MRFPCIDIDVRRIDTPPFRLTRGIDLRGLKRCTLYSAISLPTPEV
jgi:hypothetical protein